MMKTTLGLKLPFGLRMRSCKCSVAQSTHIRKLLQRSGPLQP